MSSGHEMMALIRELQPLPRSLTGDGVRDTLRLLGRHLPLEIHEVPSGTPVFDWSVPPEWNLREAWIADPDGRRVVDARASNLHVVGYSTPLRREVSRSELFEHLHSLPEHPEWIPYRTSYYRETWGFCVSEKQRLALDAPHYEVCIDATLAPGSLTYAECLVPGRSEREILISAHVCHPTLANDNLSGIAVATWLAKRWRERERELGLRVLFAPGTIGALTWLSRNAERLDRIAHGLTLVCLGDASPFTYKRTLAGDAAVDRAAALALGASGHAHQLIDYFPYGYDERQYNAPGFRLPVGSLMRGRHGRFPEYHTSADDLDFIDAANLEASLGVASRLLDVLDGDRRIRSLAPYGEPQLGRRGLYRALGGEPDLAELEHALLWVLTLADDAHTLVDVAERSGLPFDLVARAAAHLEASGLLACPPVPAKERSCAFS